MQFADSYLARFFVRRILGSFRRVFFWCNPQRNMLIGDSCVLSLSRSCLDPIHCQIFRRFGSSVCCDGNDAMHCGVFSDCYFEQIDCRWSFE